MKLFVVVFGAALAASMVAANGEVPNNADLNLLTVTETECTGSYDGIDPILFMHVGGSCDDNADCDSYADEKYSMIGGYRRTACCGGGGTYMGDNEDPLCQFAETNCVNALTARGDCNYCATLLDEEEEEEEEGGSCCAQCCDEPTGSLWDAVINTELGGLTYDPTKDADIIAKNWFALSTDNSRNLHFDRKFVKSCGTFDYWMDIQEVVSANSAEWKELTCYKVCCDCCFDLQLTAMKATVLETGEKDQCGNMADTLLWPKEVTRVTNANGAVCFATYNSKKAIVVLADSYRVAAWYFEGNFEYTYEAGAASNLLFTYLCNQKATVAHAITPNGPAPAPASAP